MRENNEGKDIAGVEDALKWHALQIGGNGYV